MFSWERGAYYILGKFICYGIISIAGVLWCVIVLYFVLYRTVMCCAVLWCSAVYCMQYSVV